MMVYYIYIYTHIVLHVLCWSPTTICRICFAVFVSQLLLLLLQLLPLLLPVTYDDYHHFGHEYASYF